MIKIETALKYTNIILSISVGVIVGIVLSYFVGEHLLLFNILGIVIFVCLILSAIFWLKNNKFIGNIKKEKNIDGENCLTTEGTKYKVNDISQYIPSVILKNIQPRDLPKQKISLVGLGCAGINMIDYIVNESFEEFDTVTIDTDIQKLSHSKANYCLYLGNDRGIVKQKTNEQIEHLYKFIHNAQIIFLLTGLGGRTGGVVTLQLTQYAKKMRKIVHVLAVTPFKEEGSVRKKNATAILRKLKALANSVTAISNDDLIRLYGKEIKVTDSFNIIHEHWLRIIEGVYVKPRKHQTIISNQVEKIKNDGFSLQ